MRDERANHIEATIWEERLNRPKVRSGKRGCLGCLGAVIGIPLLLILIGYLVIFHSSIPIKWVVNQVTEDTNKLEMHGLRGSLASGISAKRMTVHGDAGESSIDDFAFRYNGIIDCVRNKRLIIRELSATKSVFVVANDFFAGSDDPDEDDPATEVAGEEGETDGDGLSLFELRELRFENSSIRTADGSTRIEIPLIHLAGLKVENDDFDLATLEVVSDYLNIELSDATPDEVEGHRLPFTRKITGRVLPGIHEIVKAEIDFMVEFAAIASDPIVRITASGGALQQITLPDGTSVLRVNGLSIGRFLGTGVDMLPERLTMTAREGDDNISIEDGEFFLGLTRFEISSQKLNAKEKHAALLAKGQADGREIVAVLRPTDEQAWPPLTIEFRTEPPIAQPELLALIYFQRSYDATSPEEKLRIDAWTKPGEEVEPPVALP